MAVGTVTFVLGALRTVPCAIANWAPLQRVEWLCYSDVPILYNTRGLAGGALPYLSQGPNQPFEYPVGTGLFAWFAGLFTATPDPHPYYWITAVLLLGSFLGALAATAMTVPHRVWDGLLLALAPSVLLASLINWDWFAVALTSAGLWAWARSRPVLAGILLGLAVATKFYPIVLFGPLLVLCWRRRRMAALGASAAAAAVAWLIVNLPFMIYGFDGWSYFFRFSSERGQDFGSPWLAFALLGVGVVPSALNLVAMTLLASLCIGIATLALSSPRPPRLAQLAFLVVAAFAVTNKVYSPQYVLWLLPLAVLARPRWRDFLIWQACEAVYYVAVWWYIIDLDPQNKGLSPQWYAVSILVHIGGVVYLSLTVVRDILQPEHDPVRIDRLSADDPPFDDPGGGVLDHAPDRLGPRATPTEPTPDREPVAAMAPSGPPEASYSSPTT
jgi:uncharacterized membrane protein